MTESSLEKSSKYRNAHFVLALNVFQFGGDARVFVVAVALCRPGTFVDLYPYL